MKTDNPTKTDTRRIALEGRGILRIEGVDARRFLQGMITNDINRLGPENAIYSAFLTPQGKFLADFFIAEAAGALLLDCEATRLNELRRRFALYRVRADVTFTDVSDRWRAIAVIGEEACEKLGVPARPGAARLAFGGVVFTDPRLPALGVRALVPAQPLDAFGALDLATGVADDYETLRLSLGVPDGSRDMTVEKAILLENGFEALNGVDFRKGCFIGQELTARTKYRGLIKKHLFQVDAERPLPEPGTPVLREGREAGEMRTSLGRHGLALLRIEDVAAAAGGVPLTAAGVALSLRKPAWAAAEDGR